MSAMVGYGKSSIVASILSHITSVVYPLSKSRRVQDGLLWKLGEVKWKDKTYGIEAITGTPRIRILELETCAPEFLTAASCDDGAF